MICPLLSEAAQHTRAADLLRRLLTRTVMRRAMHNVLREHYHEHRGSHLYYRFVWIRLVLLFRSGAGDGWPVLQMKRKTLEE